jgi:uncharacterized protein (TIGR02466 family)
LLDAAQNAPKVVIRDLFASPVVACDWPGTERLNAELKAAIMQRYHSTPGLVSSNRKGWHSKFDMHKWPEACVAELMTMVKTTAANMTSHLTPDADNRTLEAWQIKSCWSNVNPPGGYNQPHNHIAGDTLLSGFYYVDLGGCEEREYAGRTIFQDRSGIALKGQDPLSREYAVVPKPGVLVLFPAALMHYVEPYRGTGLRISVAFNLGHPDLRTVYYPDMREQDWWWKNFRGLMLLKTKIPEKSKAMLRFASYFAKEMQKKSDVPFLQRVRVTRDRAEADEAEAREAANAAQLPNGKLPEKQPFL